MKAFSEINNYVSSCFEKNMTSQDWGSDENQKAFKKLITKHSNKKKKKSKDAPKKYSSAYILYGNDIRAEIKKENPKLSAQEIFKESGVRWKKLQKSTNKSDVEKIKEYNRLSDLDKQRYHKEMETYVENVVIEPVENSKGGKKAKKPKDTSGIKKNKSAWIIFGNEFRKNNIDIDSKNMFEKIGLAWKELKNDPSRAKELKMYEDKAAADKIRYDNEKSGNLQPTQDSGNESNSDVELDEESDHEVKPVVTKSEKPVKTKETGAKRPPSNYNSFCTKKRSELKETTNLSAKEITTKLSELWKEMSDDEKKTWSA